MTIAQKVPFIHGTGISASNSAAGLVTKTVPHKTSRTTEKIRMTHFATLPRYSPESSAMDAPPWRELIIPDI